MFMMFCLGILVDNLNAFSLWNLNLPFINWLDKYDILNYNFYEKNSLISTNIITYVYDVLFRNIGR